MRNNFAYILIFLVASGSSINAYSQTQVYSQSFTASTTYAAASTQCTAWNTFRSNINLSFNYTQIQIGSGPTATGATAVAIITALKNGTAYGPTLANGYYWEVGTCGSGIELGAMSASTAVCNCPNPGYILRPCIVSNANWGGITGGLTCGAGTQTMSVTLIYTPACPTLPALTGTTSIACGGTTTLSCALPTGGTITQVGGNNIHTFTSSGSLVVPTGYSSAANVLVVGGGGGGGQNGGGGGGGGGVTYIGYGLSAGTITATVGAGGTPGVNASSGGSPGAKGGNSVFGSVTSLGGGGGSNRDYGGNATTGGSGGGGGGGSFPTPAAGTGGQGNSGGTGYNNGCPSAGGGGGGAGGAGGNGGSNAGAAGGAGIANSISGSSVTYAGGGGGGPTCAPGTSGAGGSGGGGAGNGTNGTANTGGGGGGNNGTGGSGIVIVSYPLGTWSSSNTAIATVTTAGVVTGVSQGSATISYTLASCSVASSAVVTVGACCTPPASYTLSGASTICSGSSTTLTLSGSQSGVTYQLYNGASTSGGTVAGTGSALTWSVSTAGTYTVKVVAGGGYCSATMAGSVALAVVTISSQPVATATTCYNTAFTPLSVTATSTGTLSYQWYENFSPGDGSGAQALSGATASTYAPLVSAAGAAIYYCVISGGCTTSSTTATVDLPSAAISSPANTFSSITSGGSIVLTASGGTSYTWSNAATTAAITVAAAGNYIVTVKDANNCTASANRVITVNEVPAALALTGSTSICITGTTQLTEPFTVATGGTVTSQNGYKVHTFTGSGTFTTSTALNAELLAVGGGGGGGSSIGGGGGAGGVVYESNQPFAAGTAYTVTIGGGGAGGLNESVSGNPAVCTGTSGSATTISSIGLTAAGGGGGGSYWPGSNGSNGGSGGGAGGTQASTLTGGTATGSVLGTGGTGTIYGGSGGSLMDVRLSFCATSTGGGGGAGGSAYNVKTADPNANRSGANGVAFDISNIGTTVYYGGGGGGATYCTTPITNNGGLGGGGGGASTAGTGGSGGTGGLNAGSAGGSGGGTNGGNAGANTGGGGGGSSWQFDVGGNGGSGIVVIRYPDLTAGTWSSNNTAVATVNSSGLVTGVSAGNATISYTVTANGITSVVSSSITVNPSATLTGASQPATACPGFGAVINLTGLLPNSTSTINYSINGTAQTPITGVAASGGGTASFTSVPLSVGNNGQTLQITGITVTSASPNCTQAFATNVTLRVNPALTATVSPTTAGTYCSYANSGILTVAAGGGTPGYTYSWSNGLGSGTTASPTSSTATSYGVTVTDINSCTVSAATAAVTINPAVTVSPTPASATKLCSYGTNGAIASGSGGGTSPYTYVWNNGLGSSSSGTPTITTATVYSVTVTDSKGCTASGSTGAISIDGAVTAVVSPTATTTYCPYATSGVMGVTPGGGTGVYTYTWNNGLGTGATATPVSTSVLVYTATVTDNNGCTASANTGSVNVDPVVTVAPTPSAATLYCSYANSSVLAANAGGGSSTYTYVWSNGLGTGATATPTSATSTAYGVTVTDSKSCTASGSTGSVIVDPAVTVSPTPGAATFYCSYQNTGVLAANPGGGSGVYITYAWSGGLGSSSTASPTIGASTTYSVTVTDNKGCSASASTGVITVNPVVTTVPTPSSPAFYCSYATTNALAAVAGGGAPPYTYVWSNGLGTGANATPITATAQSYSVTVTDHNLCTASAATALVTVNPVVTANPTGLTYVCSYSNTNALAAGAGGGTPGYTYLWSNGLGTGVNATPTITTATIYTLTVTDSKSCTASASLGPVTDYAPPTITATTPGSICGAGTVNLGASASAGVVNWWPTATGGTAPSVNTGGSYTTPIISTTTTFYVDATSNGCTTTSRTSIVATVYPTTISSGGFYYSTSSVYSTILSSGTQVVSTNPVNAGIVKQDISGLLPCTTYYYVTYIVTNGVTEYASTAASFTTGTLNATISLTSGNSTQSVCNNSAISNITYTVGGGGTGATVTGLPAGVTGNYSGGVFTISGTPSAGTSGTFNYTVNTTGNCAQTSATGSITVDNILTAGQTGGSSPICYNSTPASFTATGSGGTGSYTYLWYLNGSSTGGTSSTYSAGNLIANASVYCAVTSGSCGTVNTTPASISVHAALTATITGGSSPSCYNTSPGTFTATGAGGDGTYSYQWYNSSSSISGAINSTYTAPALTAGNSYHCSVTSGSGCGSTTTGTTPITVEPPVSSYGTVAASGGLTQTVCDNVAPNSGNPLTVSGAAGSSGSFSYQWYYQNGLIAAPSGSSTAGWTACGAGQGSGFATNSFTAQGGSVNITYACLVTPASPVCAPGQWAANDVQVTVLTTGPTESSSGGASVCLNGSVSLSSSLSVAIPATYQWFSSTSPGFGTRTLIPGATATTYSPPTSTSGTLYYEVVSTFSGSGCTPATSNAQTVTVYTVPTASQSGGTSPICYNTSPGVFTATGAGGSGSFTYQWYNNSGLVGGAVSSTFNPGNLTASNAYNCTVTDAAGCGVISTPATGITVNANLTAAISGGISPICYNTAPGTYTATAAGGTGSYTYQWYNGSGSVSGATGSTYAPGNLTASNSYFCAVTSGSCGTVNTSIANVTVHANLTASITGGTTPVCYNTAPGTIRVIASGGSGTYSYQWYNSSGSVSGATASTYAPGNITSSDSYHCVVTGGTCGSITTASVAITVYANLTAAISGGTTPVCYNASPGTFTTTATGGSGVYTYQWYNSSGSIGGATASSYSPGNLISSNSYSCSVSNGICGTAVTSVYPVTVNASLTANIGGGVTSICYNSSPGTLTATGSGGTSAYTYQWYDNSGSISGAVASTYAPGNLTSSDAFHCLVTSGSCGTVSTSTTVISVYSLTSASASNAGPYVGGQTINLSGTSSGAISYQWSGPNSYSSAVQNPVISGATVGMSGAYTVTASDANGCTATATSTVVVTTTAAYTWTGTISTDWATPANWVPTAPVGGPNSCAIDVIIPNTSHDPVISSGVQVGNIQLDASAQLTLNAANISVCKNWTGGTGTQAVVAGSGVVVLNGNSLQAVTGNTQMQELMLSNTSGAAMQSGSVLDIYTSLDLASGNFNATGGALTFKSRTVDSVGIIDNFSSNYTGTLTGSITAERYYANSLTYDQHYMGSPVNTPSLAQFNASGTPGYVSDPWCDETRLYAGSPYGNVFSFHEVHGTTCGMEQWKVETTGNVQNGLGYSILKAGNGTLVLNGTANLNSSYSVTGLTNHGWSNTTVQGHLQGSGWQLVSNPYLATLNITTVPAGFDNQIQIWHANGPYAGSYQPGNVGSDATVAPFQAYMVHKTSAGGSATYVVNASDRVRSPHTFFLQNANQLNIVAANVANGSLDQTMVAFNPAATDTFDAQMDAAKFPGALSRHTLYTVNSGKWMSRNILHDEATTSTVPMGFEPGKTGTYKLTFNGLNTFDPTSYIYLEDKALNVMHNVRNGDYTFTADSADNRNRFVLHFTPAAQITTADAGCNASGTINIQQPGTANWNYTLTDSGNAIITSGTLNQSQEVTVGVAAGTYTLTLIDTNSYTVTKMIQVNGPEIITAAFQASNDIIQVGQIATLTATTSGASTYQWNFGNGTSATGAVASVSYGQSGLYTISLLVSNPAGCTATKTQTITVNAVNATGLNNLSGTGNLKIWSHSDKVYVDFTDVQLKDASVIIYDILGQEISNEKVVNNVFYQKEIDKIEAAYMIVMVRNDNEIKTKKVFINNIR